MGCPMNNIRLNNKIKDKKLKNNERRIMFCNIFYIIKDLNDIDYIIKKPPQPRIELGSPA